MNNVLVFWSSPMALRDSAALTHPFSSLLRSHLHRQQMSLVVIVFSARQQLEPVDKKRKSTACERLFTHTQSAVSQPAVHFLPNNELAAAPTETKRKHTHVDKKPRSLAADGLAPCVCCVFVLLRRDAGRVDLHI
jgi:hypothetical protein